MELIEAVIHNDPKAVRQILKTGVNPNDCQDEAKVTPLHHAAQHNSVKVIELLLTAGADIHARTVPEGQTPLDVARIFNHSEVLSVLEKYSLNMP